jgi:hypothetical protein
LIYLDPPVVWGASKSGIDRHLSSIATQRVALCP